MRSFSFMNIPIGMRTIPIKIPTANTVSSDIPKKVKPTTYPGLVEPASGRSVINNKITNGRETNSTGRSY